MEQKSGEEADNGGEFEAESGSELFRSRFLDTIGENYRERTIIIDPFTPDLLGEAELQAWIKEATEFYIRKAWTGKSLALLQFADGEKGEKALTELRAGFAAKANKQLNIGHPSCSSTLHNCCNHFYMDQALGIDQIEEQSVLSRQIILEDVPDSMSLDRIQKHFSQSISVLDYREDPDTSGTVAVEFISNDVVNKLCADAPEVKIDGATIDMFTYPPEVCKRYNNEQNGIIRSSRNEPDQFKPLNDDLRRDMCKAHKALEEERGKLFNRTDIFSQEKQRENARLCALMRPYREHLLADTRRRLDAGEMTMPEGAERLIAPVQQIMDAESKHHFHLIPEKPSATMLDLVEKASQKAAIKLSLLEKVRTVSEERIKIAKEIAQLPQKAKVEDGPKKIQSSANTSARGRGSAPPSSHGGNASSGGGNAPLRGGNTPSRGRDAPPSARGGNAQRGGSSIPTVSSGHSDWRSRGRGRGARGGRNFSGPPQDYEDRYYHEGRHDDRYYREEEPYPAKRIRGSGSGGGRSDYSQKSIDEIQAALEERLRKLEEMQLQTLQVQSQMLAATAAANLGNNPS